MKKAMTLLLLYVIFGLTAKAEEQHVFKGLQEAIQKNYAWNSTNYHPTEGYNYDATDVLYKGQILIQVVPCFDCVDMSEKLALYVDVPPSKMNKFQSMKYYTFFKKGRDNNKYYANCQNNINLAVKIASDMLLNFFKVPYDAEIKYE